jgi:hypothetical protein
MLQNKSYPQAFRGPFFFENEALDRSPYSYVVVVVAQFS